MTRPDRTVDFLGKRITPEGCGVPGCGVDRRNHVQLYVDGAGWHGYEQPTHALIAQRIRMLRSQADRDRVERLQAELDAARERELARWIHEGDR